MSDLQNFFTQIAAGESVVILYGSLRVILVTSTGVNGCLACEWYVHGDL